ncbi:hypothetical protein RHSIM_Rhsim08G0085800 [Rhododendron simsii]|uniref:Uncharacterized protein n=1 Tax=Rhododendron simsii TaxID=118357 RepID=A0A834GGG9_RHOSS|nr:hypothetical protein RHSIM_Rhsim08G0085800 [Rhododendron simsii]
MKRKKWSELEEQTLLQKYSDLLTSGTLAKLKTREKKFKPIADAVNALHHHLDPISFPFKWSWRDVSIKVQNMRHQYLGVKQKIRASDGTDSYNWTDGENHWENFLRYKEVFGDVEIDAKGKRESGNVGGDDDVDVFGGDVFGLGFDGYSDDLDENGDLGDDVGESYDGFCGEGEGIEGKRGKKRLLGLMGGQVLELREVMLRREDKRREREWGREEGFLEREDRKREREGRWGEVVERSEVELEEREMVWARREFERRGRLERELNEERRRRMKAEEKWEEEEMEWRERMLGLQIEHEKQMMQMHVESCQNQMQVLGVMARLVCQYFGSASDGLGGGLGALPPQVLQNLQHPGGLGDNGKPDANSPSEFL